jgi:hypothetical protein
MTADDLTAEVLRDGRVCPMPRPWASLWEMLPKPDGSRLPFPLILASWWTTEDHEKRERFELHLRWAEQHDALPSVADFLHNLTDADWHTESSR